MENLLSAAPATIGFDFGRPTELEASWQRTFRKYGCQAKAAGFRMP
jgi:hypothetical protein